MWNRFKQFFAVAPPVSAAVAPCVEQAPSAAVALPEAVDSSLHDAYLSGWFLHETQELLEGFAIHADDTVLDVGCGDGPFVSFCAQQGAEVIFADIDAVKVAAVAEMLKGSPARAVTPLVSDANPLPLPDARASKVIAMEVLEHVDDPAQFMRELVRVGKPGAQYLITVPDPVGEGIQKHLAPDEYFQKPNHIRVFQREEFEKLVTDAGLIIEHRVHYGFYWSIWWFFFWACKQDLSPPWHPLLENWSKTWATLLAMPDGPRIKKVLDDSMPKSQALIARKPE